MTNRTCSVAGCGSIHLAQGFCGPHYAQAKRNGLITPAGLHILTNISEDQNEGDCAGCGTRVQLKRRKQGPQCAVKYRERRDQINEQRRSLSDEDKRKRNLYHRDYARNTKYGAERTELLDQAGWACEICTTELTIETARIDHDHSCCEVRGATKTCGQCVRGVLCNSCNTGLGFMRDDPRILAAAIDYLNR